MSKGRISAETFHTPRCHYCNWIGDMTVDRTAARSELEQHHGERHPHVTLLVPMKSYPRGLFVLDAITELRCGRCRLNPLILTYDSRGQAVGDPTEPERTTWPDGRKAIHGEEVKCPACGLLAMQALRTSVAD